MPDDKPPQAPARKERKVNADRRRRQLIDATLRSVVENGLAKTTLATVASAAGLSQGVAVFYFKSKDALLASALQHQYSIYEDAWRSAAEAAGSDPVARLAALVSADFAPAVCNQEALAVWFAFWGEAKFRPRYAEAAAQFDINRGNELALACAALMPEASGDEAREKAVWIDSLTDGMWHMLYLTPETTDRAACHASARRCLLTLFPKHAEAFRRYFDAHPV